MARPASATAFGILNIVFGALGLLSLLMSLPMFLGSGMAQGQPNPVLDAMRAHPAYFAYLKVIMVPGTVMTILLIVAGVGLLRLAEWARKLSMAYAVYAIVVGVASSVMVYLYLFQPLMDKAETLSGPERAGMIGGAIGGLVGGVLGLIYPVLLLIFMTRWPLKAACQGLAQQPPLPLAGQG